MIYIICRIVNIINVINVIPEIHLMLDEHLYLVLDFFDVYELWRFLLTEKKFTEVIKKYKRTIIKEIPILEIINYFKEYVFLRK